MIRITQTPPCCSSRLSHETMAVDVETAPGESTCIQVYRAIISLDLILTHTYSFSTLQ